MSRNICRTANTVAFYLIFVAMMFELAKNYYQCQITVLLEIFRDHTTFIITVTIPFLEQQPIYFVDKSHITVSTGLNGPPLKSTF